MRKSTDGMEEGEYNTTIETRTELVLVSTFDEEGKEQYVEDLYQEFKITRDFGSAGTFNFFFFFFFQSNLISPWPLIQTSTLQAAVRFRTRTASLLKSTAPSVRCRSFPSQACHLWPEITAARHLHVSSISPIHESNWACAMV
jgi:hypothetical protein